MPRPNTRKMKPAREPIERADSVGRSIEWKRPLAVCAAICAAIFAVFWQTTGFGFLNWDDGTFVYAEPHVSGGLTWSGVVWAFTAGPAGEWYPLAMLSHMLDCQLVGVAHPGVHHFTNVVLHAAATCVLFLALLRMTGQPASPGATPASVAHRTKASGVRADAGGAERNNTGPSATPASVAHRAKASGVRPDAGGAERNNTGPCAWVAAVFAVHPLRAESVAWIAERRDVLSGLFFALVLWTYARYVERPAAGRYLAVAACFAAGLMAKPIVVTAPLVLLLLDWWPLGRFAAGAGAAPRLVVEKLPLCALALIAIAITLTTHSTQRENADLVRRPLSARLLDAGAAYGDYVAASLWPVNLSPYYPADEAVAGLAIALGIGTILLL
ncbi:MAG TPA: hypothetical protein VMF30_05815, partial [Pirellulales bacterium]|nr:hypothetical protein [Pirellulales bacterium]